MGDGLGPSDARRFKSDSAIHIDPDCEYERREFVREIARELIAEYD
jgi:hypothetical protein